MSATKNQDAPVDSGSKRAGRNIAVRVRIWPAILIALAHLAATFGFLRFGSTSLHSVLGVGVAPALATLLLLLWWLTASRVPWRDRLIGLALFIAAIPWIVFTQKSNGEMLLMLALPVMTTGLVGLLAMTCWLRWPTQRWVLVLFMVGCAGGFTALRVDSVTGDFTPLVAWRWSPTTEGRAIDLAPSGVQGTALLPAQPGPGDWPGFRGPERDSHVTGVKFPTDWATPPRELWRRPVGVGWSSFTAIGDYVFTQEQRGGAGLVTCYRADTGEEIWTNQNEPAFEDSMGSGPRATPTFDNGRLYTQGATGLLQCLDAATGKTLWQRDLVAEEGAKRPTWGFSSSPLVVDGRVVAFAGEGKDKGVVAYDCVSGELAWRTGNSTSGYSSPHFARIEGVAQVLMSSDFGIQAFVPETGELLWEHAWKIKNTPRVAQPLITDNNAILLGTTMIDASGGGTRRIRVGKKDSGWNVTEDWTVKKFRPYFNDFVCHRGYCYGFDGNRLACIDAATGAPGWQGKRFGGQVLLLTDMDLLLVLSEKGDVILVRAAPENYEELGQFKALTGKTWNHPVVAHGRLFVRNAEEAACFDLSADVPEKLS
jgi:outer membrane protein assembly factor BamB